MGALALAIAGVAAYVAWPAGVQAILGWPGWIWLIKGALGLVLVALILGSALFGYASLKAQVWKWSIGLFAIAALGILALYWLIFT